MKKEPFNPTQEQIDKALYPGVHYEISQLVGVLGYWSKIPDSCEILQNAFLESALIHVRVIGDFFVNDKRKRGYKDVLAKDYGFEPSPIALDVLVQERLDKDLAHLTYDSVNRDPSDKQWHPTMFKPLIERCIKFTSFIIDERIKCEHDDQRKAWCNLLQQLTVIHAKI